MDPLLVTIVFRALERMLVVAAGALSIWLGYKLFTSMPKRDHSSGKLALPGGVSIYLSRVGPGTFFALFGAVVIGLSFYYGVKFTDSLPAVAATGDGQTQLAEATPTQRAFSGAGELLPDLPPVEIARNRREVLETVRRLNAIGPALRSDLGASDRLALEGAVREAKLFLLSAVWDQANWGPYETFRAWVSQGAVGAPPVDVARGAALFRAGADDTAQ